ncbi:MAG: glycosyl transferase family 2 [Chloroflexota bacterium]
MAERTLPPPLRDAVEQLGPAQIMVGIPSHRNAATIGHVVRAAQAGLVQYFPELRPVVVNADAGSGDGTGQVVVETEPPDYLERILLVQPRTHLGRVSLAYPPVDGVSGKGAALRTILQMAEACEVEALVIVDSDLRSIGPEWIELLAGPILKGGFDLVTPRYARHKWDGMVASLLAYPLLRALFGLRIRQPVAGDIAIGADLIRHLLEQRDWTPEVSGFGIDAWITTTAVSGGYAVCETRLGAKIHDQADPADGGRLVADVTGELLRLAGTHAHRWTQVSTSHEVPIYGFERYADPPLVPVDVPRLLDDLVRGCVKAGATWNRIFDAATLRELEQLVDDAEADEVPVFPDELWVRTVTAALVAAGPGGVPVPEVTAALVPLIRGRAAAFVEETRDLDADRAELVVERVAKAFEAAKPALVAAWHAAEAAAVGATPHGVEADVVEAAPGPATPRGAAARRRKATHR